ncbi:hypothetical protein ACFWNK_34360 [Streptomyces sp. NPDC058417]|uniref:hypothetical protein n=1 Tax=unclassified Streptomyces TaxID=2593676 RepID=UPI00365896ED
MYERGRCPLGVLLPGGRVRPGTAVCAGFDMPLALGLAAHAAAGRSGWASVGLPDMGMLAAADVGLDPSLGLLVDHPGAAWGAVLALLLEAVPVVVVGAAGRVPDRVARRLGAVMRRSGSVLVAVGEWPGAEVRLRVREARWEGVGRDGVGLLRGRLATVVATGRGSGAVERSAQLWLPGPSGAVEAIAAGSGVGATDSEVSSRAGLRSVG